MKLLNNLFKNITNLFLIISMLFIFVGALANVDGVYFLSGLNESYLIVINVVLSIILFIIINLITSKLLVSDKMINIVKYVSFALMVIVQIVLIIKFDVKQMTDVYYVTDQAGAIANKVNNKINYSFYEYFKIYKNNNFYLLLSIYLIKLFNVFKITDYNTAFVVFNTIMVDISIVLTYLLTKKISNKKIATITLILLCLNPLNYYMLFWTYTCTYSLPFVVGFIYLAYLMRDCNKKILQIIYSVLFGVILISCYFLRPIILVPLTAIIICFVLNKESLKVKVKKYTLSFIIIIFSSILSYYFINNSINKYTEKLDTYFPATHWVMMGLHGNGDYSAKDYTYTHSYKTTDKMRKANLREIKRTLIDYKFSGLINHCVKKIFVTWSDGNSRYYDRISQDMNDNNGLNKWLIGSKRDLSVIYCNIYRVLAILMTILYLIGDYRKKKDSNFLLKLTLFGAIVFYLIWEAKDIYSYPFLFLLSIFSAIKFNDINHSLSKKISKKAYIIFSICMLGILLGLKYNFTREEKEINDYFLKVQNASANGSVDNVISDRVKIKQTFEMNKKFNRISINANRLNNNDSKYRITLYKDKEKLQKYVVTSKDLKNGFLTLNVDYDKTGKGIYYIEIKNDDLDYEDSISWTYIRSLDIDNYKGKFTIDGKRNNGDLYIRVYNKYKGTYMSTLMFDLLFIFIIVVLFIQYKVLYKNENTIKKNI